MCSATCLGLHWLTLLECPSKTDWWTCVAMRAGRKTRLIVPAKEFLGECAAWPYGAWTLNNNSFRGPDVTAAGQLEHSAWRQDMSWFGNIPETHDFFFHGWRPEKRYPLAYIAWADDDGYSVVHAHGTRDKPGVNNGTKSFTLGFGDKGIFKGDIQSGSDYENHSCLQNPGTFYNYWGAHAHAHTLALAPPSLAPCAPQLAAVPACRRDGFAVQSTLRSAGRGAAGWRRAGPRTDRCRQMLQLAPHCGRQRRVRVVARLAHDAARADVSARRARSAQGQRHPRPRARPVHRREGRGARANAVPRTRARRCQEAAEGGRQRRRRGDQKSRAGRGRGHGGQAADGEGAQRAGTGRGSRTREAREDCPTLSCLCGVAY